MKKAAGIVAFVVALQAPLAIWGAMNVTAPATLTFDSSAAEKTCAVLPTEEPVVSEETTLATMEQYLLGGKTPTALEPEEETLPAEEPEEIPAETVESVEPVEPAEPVSLDKGFVASAQIDTTVPILQKPSGTVIAGYYAPSQYKLNATERDLVERVIMSEVSGRSYTDALAVAQAIYDRSVDWGYSVTYTINMPYQFAGPTTRYTPTAIVKQAVSDVFDRGYKLTKEHLYYYYATRTASPTSFHETQRCLVETNLHRYFGPWN